MHNRDFAMRVDEHITHFPGDKIDLSAEMEKFSCECDKNCPEQVTKKWLVECPTCLKYISARCIVQHITDKHE